MSLPQKLSVGEMEYTTTKPMTAYSHQGSCVASGSKNVGLESTRCSIIVQSTIRIHSRCIRCANAFHL